MPPRVDIIETLSAMGELAVDDALRIAGAPESGWRLIHALIDEKIATIGVRRADCIQPLKGWEIAALIRTRQSGSCESSIRDGEILLIPGEQLAAAYRDEFGEWFDRSAH
ncbi:MAG: hypothetical protein SF069_11235 [Phycisphaerae bacterium]|nr:hypothetical protein [Phycisphaerae bacterium]